MKKEEDEEGEEKKNKRRQNKTIRYFLFYPLSFACFSLISFIIFFSVLPAICKREQDGRN